MYYERVNYDQLSISLQLHLTELSISLILLSRKLFPRKQNNVRAACGSIRHLASLRDWKAITQSYTTWYFLLWMGKQRVIFKRGQISVIVSTERKEELGHSFTCLKLCQTLSVYHCMWAIVGTAWLRKRGHKCQWQQPERLPECRLTISYVTWTLDWEHSDGLLSLLSVRADMWWDHMSDAEEEWMTICCGTRCHSFIVIYIYLHAWHVNGAKP